MSQIKLKHSGGNSVIIAAPDSNPASDRTLKLPSDGDGTILTTNSATGKILQVVIAQTATQASTSSQTFAEITTDLRATIVPTSATSKIIVDVSLYYSGTSASTGTTRILKDGSTMVSGASTSDSRDGDATLYCGANWMGTLNRTVFETAGNTNSRYYSPFWNTNSGTVYFNRYQSNTTYLGTSSIRVMEVAA